MLHFEHIKRENFVELRFVNNVEQKKTVATVKKSSPKVIKKRTIAKKQPIKKKREKKEKKWS